MSITEKEYIEAAYQGDILSLLHCSLNYYDNGFRYACKSKVCSQSRPQKNNYDEIIRLLIDNNADINYYFEEAFLEGDIEFVQLMINYGADDFNQGFYGHVVEEI